MPFVPTRQRRFHVSDCIDFILTYNDDTHTSLASYAYSAYVALPMKTINLIFPLRPSRSIKCMLYHASPKLAPANVARKGKRLLTLGLGLLGSAHYLNETAATANASCLRQTHRCRGYILSKVYGIPIAI